MNPTYSVHRGNEVYVYVRGHLVYKKWLSTGVSATFHVAPSGVHWSLAHVTPSGVYGTLPLVP